MTLPLRYGYARQRMRGFLRKLFLAILAVGALAALAYHSRHRIHLGDFTWSRFAHAVGQANLWLLLLSVVAIYVCFALRTLRWQRFSRYLGPTRFLDVYNGTVMGFASIFILGRAGEPVRPLLLARKTRMPVASMFGIWVLERIFDFAAAVALAALSLLGVHRPAVRRRGEYRLGLQRASRWMGLAGHSWEFWSSS